MKKSISVLVILFMLLAMVVSTASAASSTSTIGINVVLKGDITDANLKTLAKYGKVRDVVYEIDALTMQIKASNLKTIQGLKFVAAANPDAERTGVPVDSVNAEDFSAGYGTWDLDVINVTDPGANNRQVEQDGTGVYVAVLDTGLVEDWPNYFPQERIALDYGIAFGGGGGEVGTVSTQPDKWQRDTNSHGTHVTSTIIGFQFGVNQINGVAPMAKIIPVKVLNQNGSGWSSVIARGITYVADLKAGPLAGSPVVINMSLGGSVLDAVEKAAIDYAISKGVIIVASAGNNGTAGMGYPGAYAPVISVAASGWVGEWYPGYRSNWWYAIDDPEPNTPAYYYIADFSSRAKAGQDLDVAAPGSWVLGAYQTNHGQVTHYYLGGTSMASPHVAGIVALMAQKNPALTATEAESYLTGSAIPLPAGCRTIYTPSGATEDICWGDDATGAGLATADAALNAIP